MKKKLVVLFLILALCLCLLPMAASAEEPFNLWVNGVEVTTDNADDVLGDGTVSYDASTNTLTLNGAHLTGVDEATSSVIYSSKPAELTVEVKGNNTISNEKETATGIWAPYGSLHLTGTGSLKVEAEGSAVASNGVTIDSGTFNLTSVATGNSIYADRDAIVINGTANVTAKGCYGIVGNSNVTISGSAVVDSTSTDNCGIFAAGTLTISENAAVTAKGYYPALRGNTAVKITGGVVEATSVNDCGIFTPGTLTISENASVTADGYYAALRGDTAVEITGGVVEATSVDDCGISSKDGYLAITGGTVKATSENWISIFANVGDINISDTADVTATSTNGWAVYTNSGITVSDSAKLNAQTSAQDPDHGRAAVYGNTIEISENADVTAKAAMYQAIVAAQSASITGGTVQAEAVDTAIWVQNNGALQISNATVTAISSDSMAISAQGNITVSEGSNVTATSSTDAGLFSMTGEISISDSQVSATCGGSDKAAILGNNSISIDHSNVQVGGAGSGVYTSGQEVSSSGESGSGMTISNSVIKADTPPNQWGIHGENTGTTVTDSWLDLPASDNLASGGNSNSVTNSVMFEGNTGKVYGTAQVPDDVEVPEGKTLSVGEGTSLIVQDKTTLTNKGTVSVATTGTVTNEGTFVGDIQNTGTTTQTTVSSKVPSLEKAVSPIMEASPRAAIASR